MSKPPRTMHEAVFAELFGDLDGLSQRLKASQEAMTSLEAHLKEVREAETTRAAKELSEAAEKFGKVTTQSVDNFVDVANEALAKFMVRTVEIKEMLDKPLTVKSPEPLQAKKTQSPPPQKSTVKDGEKYTLKQAIGWGILAYLVTCVLGFTFATVVQYALK